MTIKTIYDYENDSVSFDGGSGLHPVRIEVTQGGSILIGSERSILNKEEASLLIEHCQRFVDGKPLCPPLAEPPRRFYHDDPETGARRWGIINPSGLVYLDDTYSWGDAEIKVYHLDKCTYSANSINRYGDSLEVTFIDEE